MKKLIIALVAIASAVVANAATVKWTASNAYVPGSTSEKIGSSYAAYFVNSATLARADMLATYYDTATEQLDLSFLATTSAASGYSNAFRDNSGVGTGASQGGTLTTTAGNSESWTGYLVVVDSTSYTTATKAFVSAELTKTTGINGQAATLGFTTLTGTQTASNWYAVPEPTSGLLMLLGVAGLALRRRRA